MGQAIRVKRLRMLGLVKASDAKTIFEKCDVVVDTGET